MVFNHTAEGNEHGPYISFRGIDNKTYYMLTPGGLLLQLQRHRQHAELQQPGRAQHGAGLPALLGLRVPHRRLPLRPGRRSWAAIPSGAPLPNPPLLESLAFDPILAKCKLIAEAWDAGGLYQVGSFPAYGRWAEWNGKYRDGVRKFLKGDAGHGRATWRSASQGSPDLYAGARARRPRSTSSPATTASR